MIFKKTRQFAKMVGATKSVMKGLCKDCEKKAVQEIILNKEHGKPLDPDIWCEACTPRIKQLYKDFNPYSKNIMEDYEK